MTTLTATDAITLLREAVQVRGADTVIPGSDCMYIHGNEQVTPGCMVGQALWLRFGEDKVTAAFSPMDDGEGGTFEPNVETVTDVNVQIAMERVDIVLDRGAVNVFREAQMAQDNQRPWGEALADAEALFAKHYYAK
jgi:hypothetical protein